MHARDVVTDLVDLVLARACLDCDRPGRVLCSSCLSRLRGRCSPVEGLHGLPTATAALPYEDDGRRLVLAHKEDGLRALAPMLGVLLADAVRHHPSTRSQRACVLIPVPGHRRAPRGFDALGDIARWACRDLALSGWDAAAARIVRSASAYRPLKELSREERRLAITGAFAVDRRRALLLGRPRGPVIVVDDVVTTGATVGEAVRVLNAARVRVDAVAAIASASRDTSARIRAPARPTPRT